MEDTKKKYKYHYVIYKANSHFGNWEIYDTAQDLFTKNLMTSLLCEYFGCSNMNRFTIKKELIAKEEWKRRYC